MPKRSAGIMDALFEALLVQINAAGYTARQGQIVDAGMVPAPKQCNSRKENEPIKAGDIPDWDAAKRRQQDGQAR